MTDMPVRAAQPRSSWLSHPRVRSLAIQGALLALLVVVGWSIYQTTRQNIAAQRMATGLDFFWIESGFSINQTLIQFSEASSYFRAFIVGLLNTLLVSVLGVLVATVLGFLIGVGRLSSNFIVARFCSGYVELIRNLPLLFQILFWYLAMLAVLPAPRESLTLFDELFINRRGFFMPRFIFSDGFGTVALTAAGALLAVIAISRWAHRRRVESGRETRVRWLNLILLLGLPAAAWIGLGVSVTVDSPVLKGFNFVGGIQVIPEFVALLFALSTYTAAFIAEIVRAGILAVPRGQTEAALSLGLRRPLVLRLVVVPQALRVIVPPLTSQYLNLIKNSSLAVAIGYPDLVAVFAGVTLNNTGQAIEIIAITMLVYLVISLIVSLAMNLYNRSIALKER